MSLSRQELETKLLEGSLDVQSIKLQTSDVKSIIQSLSCSQQTMILDKFPTLRGLDPYFASHPDLTPPAFNPGWQSEIGYGNMIHFPNSTTTSDLPTVRSSKNSFTETSTSTIKSNPNVNSDLYSSQDLPKHSPVLERKFYTPYNMPGENNSNLQVSTENLGNQYNPDTATIRATKNFDSNANTIRVQNSSEMIDYDPSVDTVKVDPSISANIRQSTLGIKPIDHLVSQLQQCNVNSNSKSDNYQNQVEDHQSNDNSNESNSNGTTKKKSGSRRKKRLKQSKFGDVVLNDSNEFVQLPTTKSPSSRKRSSSSRKKSKTTLSSDVVRPPSLHSVVLSQSINTGSSADNIIPPSPAPKIPSSSLNHSIQQQYISCPQFHLLADPQPRSTANSESSNISPNRFRPTTEEVINAPISAPLPINTENNVHKQLRALNFKVGGSSDCTPTQSLLNQSAPSISRSQHEAANAVNQSTLYQSYTSTPQPAESPKPQSYYVPWDWELRQTNDGKVYYYDKTTNNIYWPPPQGWCVRKDNEGRIFFIHLPTQTSHWKLPPPTWMILKTAEGRPFFYDPATQLTHWTIPS